jgi:hypothetical protein
MKAKMLIWLGIFMQLGFLMFTLFTAPEPASYLNIAIQELQSTNQPATAIQSKDSLSNLPTNAITQLTEKLTAINKSFGTIIRLTLLGSLLNLILLFCALRLIASSRNGAVSMAGK